MHLKRYSMPREWDVPVKGKVWVARPMPGPHAAGKCIPLVVVLRDTLKFVETMKEAKSVVSQGRILVDKRPRKELNFPLGLMDVLEIPEIKKAYRVDVGGKGLVVSEIDQTDADKKLCRIEGKRTIGGKKTQLNLHDGRNILVSDGKSYRLGDSILISLPDQKVLGHYKLEKGQAAFVVSGRNIGTHGKIKDIYEKQNMLEKATVVLDTAKGEVETLKAYIMPAKESKK